MRASFQKIPSILELCNLMLNARRLKEWMRFLTQFCFYRWTKETSNANKHKCILEGESLTGDFGSWKELTVTTKEIAVCWFCRVKVKKTHHYCEFLRLFRKQVDLFWFPWNFSKIRQAALASWEWHRKRSAFQVTVRQIQNLSSVTS